jgi:hypothetical protein
VEQTYLDKFAEACILHRITLEQIEIATRRRVTEKALLETGWNRCHAAELLGIHRNTLMRIIQECNIVKPAMHSAQARRKSHARKARSSDVPLREGEKRSRFDQTAGAG